MENKITLSEIRSLLLSSGLDKKVFSDFGVELKSKNKGYPCPSCGGRDRFNWKIEAGVTKIYCRNCMESGKDCVSYVIDFLNNDMKQVNEYFYDLLGIKNDTDSIKEKYKSINENANSTSKHFESINKKIAENKEKQKELEKIEQEEISSKFNKTAIQANNITSQASKITSHKYLTKKNLDVFELELLGLSKSFKYSGVNFAVNDIVFPLNDLDDPDLKIMNVQLINAEGQKRFLKGKTKNCVYWLDDIEDDKKEVSEVYLCEGIATGYTIYLSFEGKIDVMCCLSAHNLTSVAQKIIEMDKNIKINFCADLDEAGINAVLKVKRPFDEIILPSKFGNDFNDDLAIEE